MMVDGKWPFIFTTNKGVIAEIVNGAKKVHIFFRFFFLDIYKFCTFLFSFSLERNINGPAVFRIEQIL